MVGMTTLPIVPTPSSRVLVASPNRFIREQVFEELRARSCVVEQVVGGADALAQLEKGGWQALLLDRRLADLDSDELAELVRQRFPETEVVWLESANKESRKLAGDEAGDYPDRQPQAFGEREKDTGSSVESSLPGMIGNSRSMQPVYRAARLLAGRDTTVLITGPTGSGKELVARAIHQLSPRARRAFVVVNCAAIPETLLESELFGHARGAFTGALQSYSGRIQAAQGGTLFLDEIGEMPLSLQPKLLRFLERKEVQRLGSYETLQVDTRIAAATNANLPALVRQGKFREDLYYRLATFPLEIPPLRDRPEDLAVLARHFVEQLALHLPAPKISSAAMQMLRAQRWAGNVRELQNVMERALILAEGQPVLYPEHLLVPEVGSKS